MSTSVFMKKSLHEAPTKKWDVKKCERVPPFSAPGTRASRHPARQFGRLGFSWVWYFEFFETFMSFCYFSVQCYNVFWYNAFGYNVFETKKQKMPSSTKYFPNQLYSNLFLVFTNKREPKNLQLQAWKLRETPIVSIKVLSFWSIVSKFSAHWSEILEKHTMIILRFWVVNLRLLKFSTIKALFLWENYRHWWKTQPEPRNWMVPMSVIIKRF